MPKTIAGTDVALAEREAQEAQELLAELERASLAADPAKRPAAAAVAEQRHLAEFSRKRVELTAQRAAEARAQEQLAALGKLGADIDQLAAEATEPDGVMVKAAADLADAARAFTDACQAHDARVKALHQRASELESEPPGPMGPRETSSYVARNVSGAVVHGQVQVDPIGDRARRAVHQAASGDPDGALAGIASVTDRTHGRSDRYYRGGSGLIIGESGPISERIARQLASGDVEELTEAEVADYLSGSTA